MLISNTSALPLVLAVSAGSLVLLLCLVQFRDRKRKSKTRRYPPGPFSIPFFGPLHWDDDRYKTFVEWSRRYRSDVVGFSLTPGSRIIVLNSYRVMRDALQGATSDIFAGRPVNFGKITQPEADNIGEFQNGLHNFYLYCQSDCRFEICPSFYNTLLAHSVNKQDFSRSFCHFLHKGLSMSDGPAWVALRRFALRTLKDLGLKRGASQEAIRERLRLLLEELAEARGQPIDPTDVVFPAVGDLMSKLLFNEWLGKDPEFRELYEIQTQVLLRQAQKRPFVQAFPEWLVKLPGDPSGLKHYVRERQKIIDYVSRQIKNHETTFSPHNIRDYIDAFLAEFRARDATGDKDHPFHCVETSTNTLKWALLLMASHPDIQARVRAEIEANIGSDRLPDYEDKRSLPFTEAVMNEVYRFSSVTPLALPHKALQDTHIGEYFIPAGTIVLPNQWAVHRQPDIWPDPNHFNPDANFTRRREDGSLASARSEFLVTFGMGKRLCPGEAFARQQFFLVFVGLLQRFRIVAHPNHPLPSEDECVSGLVRASLPYKVCFLAN